MSEITKEITLVLSREETDRIIESLKKLRKEHLFAFMELVKHCCDNRETIKNENIVILRRQNLLASRKVIEQGDSRGMVSKAVRNIVTAIVDENYSIKLN